MGRRLVDRLIRNTDAEVNLYGQALGKASDATSLYDMAKSVTGSLVGGDVSDMRAQALPNDRLQGGLSDSNRPTVSIGAKGASSTSRSSYVGVRVTIPFFDGFGSTYRIREARAQAGLQQANVAANHQRIATLSDWFVARLSLAASLGKLDLGQIQNR